MSETTDRPHVLIIGAGLTGLFVAQGLKKAGIPYTIFEREKPDETRRKEWSMGIHWGLPLLESLLPPELSARLISDATVDPSLDYSTPPTNGSVIYDGVTGDVMRVLESDDKLVRASRRKLRKLISEGIDIHYDHHLTALTPHPNGTITAHFSTQPPQTGTLVLGADGPHSLVRSLLFSAPSPSSPIDSPLSSSPAGKSSTPAPATPIPGIVQLSTTFSFPDHPRRARFLRDRSHPVWSTMLHPRMFVWLCVQDVPDPDRPEGWVFFVYICWRGERDAGSDDRGRVREVKARALGTAEGGREGPVMEPYRSMVEWFPEDMALPYVDAHFWVAERWDTWGGRVGLAGDAAHPMPPFRGQGLNNALMDAVRFVGVVVEGEGEGEKGWERLVREYSDEVAVRGAEETRLTLRNGYMLIEYDAAKESPYFRQGLRKGAAGGEGEG